MKIKDAHMQAFPFIEPASNEAIKAYHPGMTLRDQFAMAAMQGAIANSAEEVDCRLWAEWSYAMADEMLKARKA